MIDINIKVLGGEYLIGGCNSSGKSTSGSQTDNSADSGGCLEKMKNLLIDRDFAFDERDGCSFLISCVKVLDGEYLVEGDCDEIICNECWDNTEAYLEYIERIERISEEEFNELKSNFVNNNCEKKYDCQILYTNYGNIPVASINNNECDWYIKYYKFNIKEHYSVIVIKDNSLEEAKEFFIVRWDGDTFFYKKIRCKDVN